MNNDQPFGMYTYSEGLYLLEKDRDKSWSEGFSCRREAAQKVGYLPGDFPVPFSSDWMLGDALAKAGYVKRTRLRHPDGAS